MDLDTKLLMLPNELLLAISDFLSYRDLVNLMCTSKAIHQVLEPFLWANIELFPPQFHKTFGIRGFYNERVSLVRPYRTNIDWIPPKSPKAFRVKGFHNETISLTRPYRTMSRRDPRSYDKLYDHQYLATLWFARLMFLLQGRTSRIEKLCAYTESLSAPLFVNTKDFNIMPLFVNLRVLELVMIRPPPDKKFSALFLAKPLAQLSTVKLYGYIPRDFVVYIFRSSATLEFLNLGLLDDPIPGNDFEATRALSPVPDDIQQENNSINNLRSYGDSVAPRPLVQILDDIPALPHLKALHLSRPTQMNPAAFTWGRVHFSVSAEEKCLEDWARLLEASSLTLHSIVFEQRPSAHERALGGRSSDEFVKLHSQPSSRRLLDMFLPLLEQCSFPNLKRIDCVGVLINEPLDHGDSQLRQKLVDICKSKGIECVFSPCPRCIFSPEDGFVLETDGLGAA